MQECWLLKKTFLTLPETTSSPLKIGRNPKGNDRISTISFQVQKCGHSHGVFFG